MKNTIKETIENISILVKLVCGNQKVIDIPIQCYPIFELDLNPINRRNENQKRGEKFERVQARNKFERNSYLFEVTTNPPEALAASETRSGKFEDFPPNLRTVQTSEAHEFRFLCYNFVSFSFLPTDL